MIAGLALPAAAQAQRAVSPGNVAPGSPSIAAPFSGDIVPQGSPIPRVLPPTPPPVGGAIAVPQVATPGAMPATNLRITAVRIEGPQPIPPRRPHR